MQVSQRTERTQRNKNGERDCRERSHISMLMPVTKRYDRHIKGLMRQV
jgi:hypothetical protein